MKELEVWKHQAGWGFVGITSGLIFGPLYVLAIHVAYDPSIYRSWSSAWHAIWLELVIAIIVGWFVGNLSAWMVYNSTSQKSLEIYRRSAGTIAKLAFIIIFLIASAYYFLLGPDQKAYPLVFWATGMVGLLISSAIGSAIASRLLQRAGY